MIILNVEGITLLIITLIFLFLLYIVIVLIFTLIVHKKYFVKKITNDKYINNQDYTEFKGLKKEQYNFLSKNIRLNGDIYYYDNKENKEIIVFSNGFNMTIQKYLPEISYLASLGYIVYTYDYAGVGCSEGKNFTGMPQAIINLEDCLKKVKVDNPKSKIVLVGHSMGAYASCNVLNLQHVDKVIAISPFHNIVDVVQDNIYQKLGKKIFLFPIIYRLILFVKFKSYSTLSTFNTLKGVDVKVLVIHGTEDKTVLAKNFINSMMSNTNGFVNYLLLENKHHFPLLSYDAMNYDLFLKHQITDLKLKYNNKIPDEELKILNQNINYNLKNKFDEGILNEIKNFLSEV